MFKELVLCSWQKLGPRDWGMHKWKNIHQVAQRLQEVIQAVAHGTFQLDRENDELTYALQNPEHPGYTRGKGVILLKFGFRDYIETYRSWQRRTTRSESTCEG